MCGINGCTGTNKELVSKMNTCIEHRGPDDNGVYADDEVTLGHLRLSILDLSEAGHQPMFYKKNLGACSEKLSSTEVADAPVGIVFNGEIYNYLELREELKQLGFTFTTETDTEVILAAYQAWGKQCLDHFNGMWAFAIYDQENSQIFLSVDRLGQKPLYYRKTEEGLIFSSQAKGILQAGHLPVSATGAELFLAAGFVPAPYTLYEGMQKLCAREYAVYDLSSKSLTINNYYEIPEFKPVDDVDALIAEGRSLLRDATRLRMRADVPIGAFLSGGFDSSLVVALMHELGHKDIHTFSLGFEGRYDETPYINIVKDAFDTHHHHEHFTEKDFLDIADKVTLAFDEPVADPNIYATYKISETARKYVTVAMTGDGGDEIFGGYGLHRNAWLLSLVRKIPRPLRWVAVQFPSFGLKSFRKLKAGLEMSMREPQEVFTYKEDGSKFKPASYVDWRRDGFEEFNDKANGNIVSALSLSGFFQAPLTNRFLVRTDRASMAHALEIRSPFLDYRLIEFSQKIPNHLKATYSQRKVLMRRIIDGILPREIVERKKQGFGSATHEWTSKPEYKDFVQKGAKHMAALSEELEEFLSGDLSELNAQYKMRLYMYAKWLNEYQK